MPVKHLAVPANIQKADNLPNGGNTPEKKVNKRVNLKGKHKANNNLETRRADFDRMTVDKHKYTRPGSNKK